MMGFLPLVTSYIQGGHGSVRFGFGSSGSVRSQFGSRTVRFVRCGSPVPTVRFAANRSALRGPWGATKTKGYQNLSETIKQMQMPSSKTKGCQGLPRATKGYQGLPRATKGYQGLPRATKGYQGLPSTTQNSQEREKARRKARKCCERLPKAAKGHQSLPRANKTKVLPKATKTYESHQN